MASCGSRISRDCDVLYSKDKEWYMERSAESSTLFMLLLGKLSHFYHNAPMPYNRPIHHHARTLLSVYSCNMLKNKATFPNTLHRSNAAQNHSLLGTDTPAPKTPYPNTKGKVLVYVRPSSPQTKSDSNSHHSLPSPA
jgi:hypothetical protein